MALILADRVKETSTTAGTGTLTLNGAAFGFQSFAAIGNANTTYYAIYDNSSGGWEVGIGTYTASGTTLSRDTILDSSNAGAAVSFSSAPKEVFCTYPSEKAIYEEATGEVLFDGGPITIIGTGVTSYTSFTNFFAEMFGNANTYVQTYIQNQNSGSDASADYVALNDIGTDSTYYVDMGMNSSGFTSGTYQIYTPNSGYVYSIGGGTTSKMFVGSGDDDLILHAGGFATTNIGLTILGADQTVVIAKDATVGGTLDTTGAASFGSTVLLSANPSLALQAATKQYVDNQVTAGLHIHEPVLVETTGNLTASYTQGGTTFNITDITGNKTLTTSVNHGLSINDQIWLYTTAGNGLSINTAYFVYSTPALNQITVSLTFGGAEVTGLTNATGLTYNTRANSGVGATLTNSGTQVALTIDNVALALTNRVMVRLQTSAAQNGVYTVTTVGTGATNWVLTRATDSNKVNPADPQGLGTGDYYYTQDGDLNAGDSHVLTTEPNTMIIGYTDLTYTQFSGAVTYTGVAPIDVTGQTISLTGTVAATNGGTGTNTVTTGDLLYGSATNTWSKLPIGSGYKSLTVNAGGTQVEWNAVALNQSAAVSGSLGEVNGGTGQSAYTLGDLLYASAANTLAKLAGNTTTTKKFLGQTGTGGTSAAPDWSAVAAADVTGLAPSATTDTTNAANITSGTLPSGRLIGGYTNVTAVGTLVEVLTTGQIESTQTGSAVDGAGQLFLNGATSNRVEFNTEGVAAPATTTRSAGTKVLLYPAISGSQVDYAMGIEPATLWSSVPVNSASFFFKWYGGTSVAASLTGDGTFNTTAYTGTTLTVTGSATGAQVVASNGLVVNSNTVAASYSIPVGSSASSVGPMSVASGAVVTIPTGSRWLVL